MDMELYQEVSLTRDLPSANLKKGDIGVLVDFVPHKDGGEEGAILEIFNAIGESISVVTVPVSMITALRADQVPTVRPLLAVA